MTNAKFKKFDWKNDALMICPECLETISRCDIQQYAKCPYCDCSILIDSEVEDYILKPIVDRWIFFQNAPSRDFAQIDP